MSIPLLTHTFFSGMEPQWMLRKEELFRVIQGVDRRTGTVRKGILRVSVRRSSHTVSSLR